MLNAIPNSIPYNTSGISTSQGHVQYLQLDPQREALFKKYMNEEVTTHGISFARDLDTLAYDALIGIVQRIVNPEARAHFMEAIGNNPPHVGLFKFYRFIALRYSFTVSWVAVG